MSRCATRHSPHRGAINKIVRNLLLHSLWPFRLAASFSSKTLRNTKEIFYHGPLMPLSVAGEMPSNSDIGPNPTTISSTTNSTATQELSSQTKTEAEEAADRLYEERIEEEYAKREGGA
jgi:hypothetical protein